MTAGSSGAREDLTVGVEEEFFLVDPESRRLVPRAGRVLAASRARAGDGQIEHELQQSQVETGTGVCVTLAEVRAELVRLRRAVSAAAVDAGCRIVALGTHPISVAEGSRVTPEPAYLRLERDYQQVVRQQVVCGCHVHVGLSDPEVAIDVLNRVRHWLPALVALGVNSPFWLGEDTGYASFRTEVWRSWPMSGTPEPFTSRGDYEQLVQDLLRSDAIDDPARIYWDVRPSARFDTLEFRVTDTCMTVDEAVMVTGLVGALVRTARWEGEAGAPLVAPRAELLRAATWRAARYGTDGSLVDLRSCRSVPAAALIGDLLRTLRPALEEAGEWGEVSGLVAARLEDGTGAVRQRRAHARRGSLEDVVDAAMAETVA